MKIVKIAVIALLAYVGVVVLFESLLGYFQPANEGTLVITTSDRAGHSSNRVLSRLVSDGRLYVAANHWPRAWYRQALLNPDVVVELDGQSAAYVAVPVSGDEHRRVDTEFPLGPVIRILTGFPPRYFVRLDPVPMDPVDPDLI
jgi:hypothetical protein